MQQLILVIHVLVAIAIIALVLMQHGRGADVGASFGSGSSNTMFGSAGALPFLMKVTAVCAALFFMTSISLSYLAARSLHKNQLMTMPIVPANKAAAPVPAQTSSDKVDAGFSFAPSAPEKTNQGK